MKYYIATKLENHEAHNKLRDMLAERGHQITYDWTEHGPVYSSGLDRVREVAILETCGVKNADYVIVLWPGGRGTHVELGIAIAAGKRIIIVSPIEDHHIASKETCAFYHHYTVVLVKTINECLDLIEKTK